MDAEFGKIVWQDLTVKDAEKIKDFYSEVVGWTSKNHPMGDYDDFEIKPSKDSEETIAGICHARGSNANLPPQWLMYVNVENIDQSVTKCEELGGRVLDGPRTMGPNRFCVIQDPEGAVLALISNQE
ncbi:VOC family protein [Pseudalkalibacillus sp. SCS-8]|uniref:VOC family protein n=1 Tax=Pseudalkalibacillus nanhaiensis TaxID=3115291 RepID=UPI0032DBDDAD